MERHDRNLIITMFIIVGGVVAFLASLYAWGHDYVTCDVDAGPGAIVDLPLHNASYKLDPRLEIRESKGRQRVLLKVREAEEFSPDPPQY